MRKESLDRIRQSVAVLLPRAPDATRLFYDRLFTIAPETRELFKSDPEVQRQHFSAALAVILKNVTMLDVLTEPLRQLGSGHAMVGVRPHHYPIVRDAMLHAMSEILGSDWTPELADDWRDVFDTVSRIMMSGGTQVLRQK
ncbi:MAG: hemoglobin-like flavoprotein [Phycisphaerales bacterium]|nr:hemoglobin-like flavoprotein [Phycisphaerales bacterium]